MPEVSFGEAYPFAVRAAQVRAAQAVLSGAVATSDQDDLEQEGLLACWQALPSFDPNRAALRTFVETVIANRLVSLHRARRCRPRFCCLESANKHRVGHAWARRLELRADVARVIASLDDSDRRVALELMQHTPSEAGHRLGVARSTIYVHICRIRIAFELAGLGPSRPKPGEGRRAGQEVR